MRHNLFLLLLTLCLVWASLALAAEGDPLLSVDDLSKLSESYEAFLNELGEVIVERGLLDESELQAWHDTQMGDYYQNGGYGSVLANYMPGLLGYAREEDTLCSLTGETDTLLFTLSTMRRYTPQDSTLPGLMLTCETTDHEGHPLDVTYTFDCNGGTYLKWDAFSGTYQQTGTGAESEGETVVWSDQKPLEAADDPVLSIRVIRADSDEELAAFLLTLSVSGDGFDVRDDALVPQG